ncbi:ABC transporter substrate-binding protein [Natronobacterium haloterrestre]|nr:ABC transporter substrate-binding protein [Halobiforma haloterrestris]
MTRRDFCCGIGAGMIGGLAGCLSSDSPSLTVAYVPIYPNMHHYVMEAEGIYDELDATVNIERFASGPDVVTAYAAGDIDAAFFGVTPAMVLVDQGVDAAIVTANSRNGFRIVGTETFARRYDAEGTGTFETFEAEEGRRPRIAAPPDGSVPDILLRYWIEADHGYEDTVDVVDKRTVPPANAPEALAGGDIDATVIQEPFATAMLEAGAEALRWSGDVLPDHPVTALFVHDRVPDETTVELVDGHAAATDVIESDPSRTAEAAASVIGSGIDGETAERALDSPAADFLSNPRTIATPTVEMSEFVAGVGNVDEPVSENDLFDFAPYDTVE